MTHTEPSRDRIEALLRSTGRRPDVPAYRADRIEAKVKAEWKADLRRRSRRRFTWMAGVATAATIALGVAVALRSPDASAPVPRAAARVDMVFDAAWSQAAGSGSPTHLRRGDAIRVGSEVATEDRSRLALRLGTGHSLRLDTATRVTLVSDRIIVLDRGAVYVDSKSAGGEAEGSVEIRTPLGSVRDLGTQFEVRSLATALQVRVREGKVVVEVPATAMDVVAGQQLELRANGEMTRQEMTSGQDLDWIGHITPMLDINGRSLREFLEWNARERGLRLEFVRPEAARSASEIRLNGSLQGMTLDEALESVLSTSRMSSRIEGNILRVQLSKESQPTP